ncbi:MAG TPA: hypothetical protein VJG32_17350 [Anaerolineae bacterium]|nr:hypothetical protein [Anaerolineae bacterium]
MRWAGPHHFLLLLLALHAAGILYYFPPDEVFGNPPIARTDYATHFYQAATVTRFLRETGHAWGYDPYLLAGYPLGSVFELNNAGLAAGTWLLSFVVEVPMAYNLVILALFAAIPLVVCAAGWLVGLSRGARSLAVLLALGLWYTDPALRLAWSGGTFAFAVASVFALLTLAAFVRYLDSPIRRNWVVLALTAPLTILVAPQIVVVLIAPVLVALLKVVRRISARPILGLLAVAGIVALVNAFWIEPFLRFADIKTSSDQFLQAGFSNLFGDVIGAGRIDGGPPCRCGLRWLTLGFAAWLWRRREGDSHPFRGIPAGSPLQSRASHAPIFFAGAIAALALAYLGSYWQPLADLQPYRFVIPASLLAVLSAADAAVRAATAPPRLRGMTLGVAVVVIFLLARTVEGAWYFRPHLSRLGQPILPDDDRLGGLPASHKTLLSWIETHTTHNGRLLINDWRAGTVVPYYTGREVIGGPFLWTWIQHGHANAGIWDAFGRDLEDYTEAELRQALQTYNVQWVVTYLDFDRSFYTLDNVARRWPDLLQPVDEVAGFRIYRTSWTADSFLVGSGQATATYNSIRVHAASPDGVVLKYHWLPTLRSDPPLPLDAYPAPGDSVGFIQVDNGPTRDFTIYNGY